MAAGIIVATNLEEVVMRIACAMQAMRPSAVWSRAVGSCMSINDMSWLNLFAVNHLNNDLRAVFIPVKYNTGVCRREKSVGSGDDRTQKPLM